MNSAVRRATSPLAIRIPASASCDTSRAWTAPPEHEGRIQPGRSGPDYRDVDGGVLAWIALCHGDHLRHRASATQCRLTNEVAEYAMDVMSAEADRDIDATLATVGPRLRALRRERDMTLAQLAEATGITVSTLSRLESGLRRPALDLLLPVAQAYGVTIDDVIRGSVVRDPRVRPVAQRRHGMTFLPLTSEVGGLQAFKVIVPGANIKPTLRTHQGYEWLYVLSGSMRVRLADHDLTMGPGEAAEFDTRNPHWFGSADGRPVEILSLFSQEGERMHVRAAPARHS